MSAAKKSPKRPDPEKLTFEQAVAELTEIVERIEDGAVGLEESLAERTRGEALIARCRSILAQAEQELESVQPEAEADDEDAG